MRYCTRDPERFFGRKCEADVLGAKLPSPDTVCESQPPLLKFATRVFILDVLGHCGRRCEPYKLGGSCGGLGWVRLIRMWGWSAGPFFVGVPFTAEEWPYLESLWSKKAAQELGGVFLMFLFGLGSWECEVEVLFFLVRISTWAILQHRNRHTWSHCGRRILRKNWVEFLGVLGGLGT